MNNKYEQLIEFIINDETDKARALFHTIAVEKSRDIYESLVAEEDLDEVGGNEVEGLVDEISLDEEGISEDEDEFGAENDLGAEDDAMDFDADGEVDAHEEEHGDVESRVVDLEDALDELKAEFDALMAGEESEEEAFPGIHGDDEGSDELDFANGDEDDAEIVREYVEKVAAPSNTEGSAVGTGKSVAINKKSTVAGKNDMGGNAKNFARSGTENGGTVQKPTVTNASNINVPGGKAGNAFSTKEKAVTTESRKRK